MWAFPRVKGGGRGCWALGMRIHFIMKKKTRMFLNMLSSPPIGFPSFISLERSFSFSLLSSPSLLPLYIIKIKKKLIIIIVANTKLKLKKKKSIRGKRLCCCYFKICVKKITQKKAGGRGSEGERVGVG